MLDTYTVSFFGHRMIDNFPKVEDQVEEIVRNLIHEKQYVEFLVGRDGDFDQIVASTVRRVKRAVRDDNSVFVWVMPYPKAEYENNTESFDSYYDEVEVCQESCSAHFKAAIAIRNNSMIERSDLVVAYVERKSGGAYRALEYAEKTNKKIINIAESP